MEARNKPVLCIECRWIIPFVFVEGTGAYLCQSPESPFTEFIFGRKECSKINRGMCAYFQAREVAPPLPIVPPGMNN